MTIAQMHEHFKVLIDKVDTQSLPDFQRAEIDLFLNLAQTRIVKTRYGINNIYQKGFEQSQKRIDDLREIHITAFKGLTPIEPGLYKMKLSGFSDNEALTTPSTRQYWFLTRLQVKARVAAKPVGTEKWVTTSFHQADDILTGDPFNAPETYWVYHTFENGEVYVYCDKRMALSKARLSFVSKPTAVRFSKNASCELAEHLHDEIVYLAVQIALESVESPRIQTNQAVNVAASE